MDTHKHGWKRKIRKGFIDLVKGIFGASLIFIATYIPNSFFGGYWLIPERDGRDRYSFGLSMSTAIMWQPRFGHYSLGRWDYLGAVYWPLIEFDRKFIHSTHYLSDEGFDQQFSHLEVSQIHPYWRDEFATKIKASAILDETNRMIHCTLHYTGSEYPREIYTIRLPKKFAEAVNASPPAGFTNKPFEGRETNRNEYSTRWVGKITLPQNQDVFVDIPAGHPKANKGYISFAYQRTDDPSQDFKSFTSVEFK